MKTYIFSSIFLMLALFCSANLQPQQVNNGKNNYVVLTKKVPQLQPLILTAEALKADVQLVACGFSLHKFKVDETKVPKEMKVVKNGILHNFQLQKKGYKSISL